MYNYKLHVSIPKRSIEKRNQEHIPMYNSIKKNKTLRNKFNQGYEKSVHLRR